MLRYFILLCLLPTPAFAYFDIGTGSYIFQVVAASALGVIYTVRHHIRVFVGKLMFWKKKEDDISSEQQAQTLNSQTKPKE